METKIEIEIFRGHTSEGYKRCKIFINPREQKEQKSLRGHL